MSISARGPRNHLVLENSGILIKEIWDAVADHKSVDWLMQRYPITANEVFECIDALIDLTEPDDNDFICLKCANEGNSIETMELETVGITDRIFFSIVSYGKTFDSNSTDIQHLFTYGLMLIINDCLADIKQGITEYKESYLHNIVYNAFVDAYSQVAPVDSILDILDKESFFNFRSSSNEQN